MSLLSNGEKLEEIPTDYCFCNLFKDFKPLTSSPELGAKTLKPHCYDGMFQGCSNLSYIKALFKTEPGDYYTSSWVSGVAAKGKFVMNPDATWREWGVSGIPEGWNLRDFPEDDDDNVYETIEYLSPNASGGSHNLMAEQTDPENTTLWTYSTTGGDPYIPLKPLSADAAGPVMVFKYKSTATLTCEFFWCSGGYGVKGPVGGVETAFTLKENQIEWQTFVLDFQSEWTKFGFEGKKGDTVRLDIGNAGGETVVIKGMHWRQRSDD